MNHRLAGETRKNSIYFYETTFLFQEIIQQANNGQVYWYVPFQPGNMIMNIADPVYAPPYLFLSGFFDGSYLLELDQETTSARLVYHRHGQDEKKTEALHCCISTPLIRNGYVYGVGSYGETRCLDLLTGERIWEDLSLVPKARWANVHLIPQGDKVWGFNELGELRIFVRSDEHLVCIQVNNP